MTDDSIETVFARFERRLSMKMAILTATFTGLIISSIYFILQTLKS